MAHGHSKIRNLPMMKRSSPSLVSVSFKASNNDTENNIVKIGCVTWSLTSQNWPFFLRAFILATVESRKLSSSKIKYPLGIILEIKPLQKQNNNMLKSVFPKYITHAHKYKQNSASFILVAGYKAGRNYDHNKSVLLCTHNTKSHA